MTVRTQALQTERDAMTAAEVAVDAPDLDVFAHPSLPDLWPRKAAELETALDRPDHEEAMR